MRSQRAFGSRKVPKRLSLSVILPILSTSACPKLQATTPPAPLCPRLRLAANAENFPTQQFQFLQMTRAYKNQALETPSPNNPNPKSPKLKAPKPENPESINPQGLQNFKTINPKDPKS